MTKTVLITGASSGFGEACARLYANSDVNLVLLARREEKLRALAQSLPLPLSNIHIVVADLCNGVMINDAIAALPVQFKDVDILINNGGLALGITPAQEADIDDWESMVDTNIKGLIRMTRLILPRMIERDRGHIVNIGSVAGSWPYPGGNTYCGTKAFVQQFSRALRADLLGTRIRVSNIDPGMAETEFSQVRMHGNAEKAEAVYQGTKPLVAEDIADIIVWMTSVPEHINVNSLEVMPTCQAWGPLAVHRDKIQ